MRKVNLPFALYSGIRNLFAYRRAGGSLWRMSSAVVGIALSLIPLNIVLVVTDGMIEGITERFVELGTGHLQIRAFHRLEEDEIERVEGLLSQRDDIRSFTLTCQGNGLLASPAGRTGILIKGLPPDVMERDGGFRKFLSVQEGTFDLLSPDAVMISAEAAKKLDVHPGDRIRLLVAANPGGRGIVIRPSSFVVTGIFSTGYYELDSLTAYVSLEEGRKLFRNPGGQYFSLKVDDPFTDIDTISYSLQNDLPEGWYVYTWYELERPMYETFKTTKSILLFIMILILLVASVNISSSLVMLVLEKEQDIAILKSAGASPGTIAASFIVTGFFLGLFGTIIGMTAGLALAIHVNDIILFIETALGGIESLFGGIDETNRAVKILDPSFYLEEIPIRLHITELWMIAVFAILCSTLAAYFPARRSGTVKPLDIIRKH